jgi:DNA mismatch repair protein MutS
MILDDYIEYDASHKKKYGRNTVIFMQVGDFFELYAYTNTIDDDAADANALIGADLPTICDMCNLQMTRKNKAIPDATKKNPYMAGFPLYILSKHVQTLTQNGYTVAVVKQVTPPPNPRREVTDVFSPGTQLNATQRDGNYLMVVYTDVMPNALEAVGLAAIDVSNGSSVVFETASTMDNVHAAQDEVVRWMQAFAPREVVFLGKKGSTAAVTTTCVHENWGNAAQFEKPAFQNETFEHAFKCSQRAGLLTPSEALGLETWGLARVALAALLQFVHEHNESLAKELEPPRFLAPTHHLHLDANSAQQLNIVGSAGGSGSAGAKPLLALLNKCGTAFGARLLRDRLMHPSTDVAELEVRYDAIARHMAQPEQTAAARRYLASVQDLERLARRLALQQFAPMEWPTLVASAHSGAAALEAVGGKTTTIRSFIKTITATLRLDECSKYALGDVKANVFARGVQPDLDALEDAMMASVDAIQRMANALSALVPGDATCVKVEINDRDGYVLTTTKRRWQTVCSNTATVAPELRTLMSEATAKPISASSTTVRLYHPSLAACSDQAVTAAAKLKAACTDAYKQWLATTCYAISKEVRSWIGPIADLDVSLTNAKCAMDYAYCRPTLSTDGASSLKATQLRHPMIERFLTDVAYVPNDVSLGSNATLGNSPQGWLLYGMNAAGKSSLMKAIGLAVVMAQAGMYVAAEAFECTPFRHLFTRITASDNIYRGMSTFVVEMTELRNILQRADDRSLVLGDELCAGTEALSGLAIVSAGISELLKRSSTFVFATHLHDLVDIDVVKEALEAGKVRACHLHVEVMEVEGVKAEVDGRSNSALVAGSLEACALVYDRTLREGIGHKTYGLEVCKGLGLPDSFIKQADAIRRTLMDIDASVVPSKGSRYNARVSSKTCGLCGQPATEVHHIQPQKTADARGFHGHVHKNHGSNLVALCEACHLKQHKSEGPKGEGANTITGYTKTTKGRVLTVV